MIFTLAKCLVMSPKTPSICTIPMNASTGRLQIHAALLSLPILGLSVFGPSWVPATSLLGIVCTLDSLCLFPWASRVGPFSGCPARCMIGGSTVVNVTILGLLGMGLGPQRSLIRMYLVAQFVWSGGWMYPLDTWRGIATRIIMRWKAATPFNKPLYLTTRYQRWTPDSPNLSLFGWYELLLRFMFRLPSSLVVQDVFLVDTVRERTRADFGFVPGNSTVDRAIHTTIIRHLAECHFVLGADVFNVLLRTVPSTHPLYRILATVLAGSNTILHESMSTNCIWSAYLEPGYDLPATVLRYGKSFDYVRYRKERFQCVELQAYQNCLAAFVNGPLGLVQDEYTIRFVQNLSTQWNETIPNTRSIHALVIDILMSAIIYHELYGHVYVDTYDFLEPLLGHPAVGATAILGWCVQNKVSDFTLLFEEEPELACMAKTLKALLGETQTRLRTLAAAEGMTLYLCQPIEPVLMH